jgi:O-antigen ligase/tetratricopeptide (TPR) repeat protein
MGASNAPQAALRARLSRVLAAVMEVIVLLMVTLSPWVFGAVHPISEFILFAALSVLLGLWGLRILVDRRLQWRNCPLALCLAGLFVLGVFQTTPLPTPLLEKLSPTTARLNNQLRPAQPEILRGESTSEVPAPIDAVSVYPGATRAVLLRVLAVFVLFVVVRNNVASPGSLKRLCIVAVVNGTLLALFALVQFFTSPRDMVYWTYPTLGSVYGPFICRNHFPFYLNMCIGLGLGLLLAAGASNPGREGTWLDRTREMLGRPAILWIGAALALMLASVAFSLSRGGVLALVGAGAICLLGRLGQTRRMTVSATVALPLALAVGLVGWFGFGAVEKRMATVWKGEALEGRLPVWNRVLPTVYDFPIWGSGYGTFQYVEPLSREPSDRPDIVNDHAHNEYLEMLLEGGAVGAILSLVAIGLVLWYGCRAVSRCDAAPGGLALGAVFAFATAMLHAVGDFGLHMPAIVVLMTVVSAQVMALPESTAGNAESHTVRLTLWGLAPIAGAMTAGALGLLLYWEGARAERAERFRLAAIHCRMTPSEENQARQIRYLEAAVRMAPDDAMLQLLLAQTYESAFEQEWKRMSDTKTMLRVTQLIGDGGAPLNGANWVAGMSGADAWVARQEQELSRRFQVPAMRHFLQTRNLCPMFVQPHLRIAAGVGLLARSDPPRVYVERALFLLPCDAAIWYAAGLQELADGQPQRAWPRWRRSLESSDRHLPEILTATARRLGPAEIADKVIPDRPELLIASARQLEEQSEGTTDVRPLYQKVLIVLDQLKTPLSAEHQYFKAVGHRALGESAEALTAYQAALDDRPGEFTWRYEFAELLRRQSRTKDAHRELRTILATHPNYEKAQQLYDVVLQEIAEGE